MRGGHLRSDRAGRRAGRRRLEATAVPRLIEGGFRCAYCELRNGSALPYTTWAGWVDREVRTAYDHVLLRGDLVRATAALEVPSAVDVAASVCRLPPAPVAEP